MTGSRRPGRVALGLGRASAAVGTHAYLASDRTCSAGELHYGGIQDKHIRGVLELKPWLVSMPVSGAPGYLLTVSVVVAVNAFRKLDAVAVLTV